MSHTEAADVKVDLDKALYTITEYSRHNLVLNELCFWTLSIVWCLKNKQNGGIKNYRQKITIHTSTNKSHKGQLLTTEQLTWARTHINP
jgi:hypothetical protein